LPGFASCLLLSLKFILAVYENQAYDLLVLPLTLFGLLRLVERRDVTGAASPAMIIFLPYLLLKRRFIGAAKAAFWSGPNPLNHSIHGAIARLVDGTSYEEDFLLVLRTAQIVFVGVLSVLLIVSARLESTIPMDGSLLVIAMLMLSPMTSHSHYVALMLPCTVIVAYWLRHPCIKLFGRRGHGDQFPAGNGDLGRSRRQGDHRLGLSHQPDRGGSPDADRLPGRDPVEFAAPASRVGTH
jgi:hypothetical protein